MRRLRLGNPVGRARGRVMRVAGVPNTPNLPSGRALVQNAARDAVRVPRSGGRRGRSGADAGPANDSPADGRLGRTAGFVFLFWVVLALYLLVATPHPVYHVPPPTTCYDRVVWHHTRLSDC